MKKSSVIFVGVILIMCLIGLIMGCSQPTDLVATPVLIPEPTSEEITEKKLRDSIQESLDYLDVDMNDFAGEYEQIVTSTGSDFQIHKIYITEDNSRIINPYSFLLNGEYEVIENNVLTEGLYDNKVVVQGILDLKMQPLDLTGKTIKWKESVFNFSESGFAAYKQEKKSWLRDTGDYYTQNLGEWREGSTEPHNVLLKKTGTHVIVIYLQDDLTPTEIELGGINIYRAQQSFPLDYVPEDTLIESAKQKELTSKGIDIENYIGPYKIEHVEGSTGVDYYSSSIYLSGNNMVRVDTGVSNGTIETLQSDGSIKIEESFNEAPSVSVTEIDRTKNTESLTYNGSAFSLNGYTWYSWNNRAGTPVDYLMKEGDNKLYQIMITVNNNEITDIENLEVYTKL